MNQQGFDASTGAGALSKLFAHFDRTKILDQETGKYHYEKYPSLTVRGNKRSVDYSDIDASRTNLNYNLAEEDQPLSQLEFFENRLSEIYVHKSALKNALVDWVITLPNMAQYVGKEREFFEVAYNAMCEKYGCENVVSAYVHMDEVQPHMHFVFVPVARDKKHEQGWKLSRKAVNTCEREVKDKKTGKLVVKRDTREYSKQAHEYLESRVCDAMGFTQAGVVLTEEQLKKRTIKENMDGPQELKQAQERLEAVENDLAEATKQRDEIQAQIALESARLESLRRSTRDLGQEVDCMAAAAAKINKLESAPRREYGARCREITFECNSYTAKISRGIEQLRERISAVKQRITEQIKQSFGLDARKRQAMKLSQERVQQYRSRSRDVGLER